MTTSEQIKTDYLLMNSALHDRRRAFQVNTPANHHKIFKKTLPSPHIGPILRTQFRSLL